MHVWRVRAISSDEMQTVWSGFLYEAQTVRISYEMQTVWSGFLYQAQTVRISYEMQTVWSGFRKLHLQIQSSVAYSALIIT